MKDIILLFAVHLQVFCIYNQQNFVKALIGYNIRDSRDSEFPTVVCIAKISSGHLIPDEVVRCGGTLITQNHVLTAEHCLEMVQATLYRIIMGSVDIRIGIMRTPLWWMTYDQWAHSNEVIIEYELNDIGILKVNDFEGFHIIPSSIYTGTNNQLSGLYVDLVGWGSTNYGQCPAILQTALVGIISNEFCESIVYNLDRQDNVYIHRRYICSIIQPYVLVDSGDSGGPLLFQNVVLGITSGTSPYLNGSFHQGKVNCHTGVEFYRNFINDVIFM